MTKYNSYHTAHTKFHKEKIGPKDKNQNKTGREKIAEKGVKKVGINNTKNERYYCSSPLIGASMHTMPVPARFLAAIPRPIRSGG